MSVSAIERFFTDLVSKPNLRAEADERNALRSDLASLIRAESVAIRSDETKKALTDLVGFANSCGYNFTKDDVRTYFYQEKLNWQYALRTVDFLASERCKQTEQAEEVRRKDHRGVWDSAGSSSSAVSNNYPDRVWRDGGKSGH